MRLARTIVLAIASVFVLAACSADASDDGIYQDETTLFATSVSGALTLAQQNDLEWEASILADGTITAAEYEDAHDRYMQCQKDLGYVLKYDKWLDPIDGLTLYSILIYDDPETVDAVTPVMTQKCDKPYYLVLETYRHTTPHRMDPNLIPLYQKCLTKNDIEFSGTERSLKEFVGESDQASAIAGAYGNCAQEAVVELRPDGPNMGGIGDLGP